MKRITLIACILAWTANPIHAAPSVTKEQFRALLAARAICHGLFAAIADHLSPDDGRRANFQTRIDSIERKYIGAGIVRDHPNSRRFRGLAKAMIDRGLGVDGEWTLLRATLECDRNGGTPALVAPRKPPRKEDSADA